MTAAKLKIKVPAKKNESTCTRAENKVTSYKL